MAGPRNASPSVTASAPATEFLFLRCHLSFACFSLFRELLLSAQAIRTNLASKVISISWFSYDHSSWKFFLMRCTR